MATLTFLLPNTASQKRSSRIPQHEWCQLKSEIVERYRHEERDRIARTLKWLQKRLPGFSPSRKQLERQLKVIWQVDTELPEIPEELPEISVEEAVRDFQSTGSHSQTRDDDTILPVGDDTHHIKRGASETGERMHTIKRRRLETPSKTEAEWQSTIVSGFDPVSSPSDGPSMPFTEAGNFGLDQYEIQPTEFHSKTMAFNATTAIAPDAQYPHDDDPIPDMTNGMAGLSQVIHALPPLAIETSRLFPILQGLNPGLTAEDADDLVAGLNTPSPSGPTSTIRLLDTASSFFSSHLITEETFPLFFAMANIEGRHKRCFHRIISCIYATRTASDAELVDNFLSGALLDPEVISVMILDRFLLHVAKLMLVKQDDGEDIRGREHIGKATSIFQGVDTFLRYKQRFPHLMQLDVTTYTMTHLAFGFLGVGDSRQSIEDAHSWGPQLQESLEQLVDDHLKALEDDFLHQIPGPFEIVEDTLQNPCLKNCLEWCKARLRAAYRLPPMWETIRRVTIHKEWTETVAVYWYLWTEFYKLDNAPDIAEFWTENSEQVIGIPAAQLLFSMASLMMEVSPSRKRYSRLMRKDYNVLLRAIAGVEILGKMSDEEFARSLLSQIVGADFPFYLPDELRSIEVRIAAAQTFQAGVENVFPYLLRHNPVSDSLSEVPSQLPMRQPSLSATLATSHSSSTMSSMRRLAVGISRHARAQQRPGRSNSRTSALTVDDLSDTISFMTFASGTPGQPDLARLSRTSF